MTHHLHHALKPFQAGARQGRFYSFCMPIRLTQEAPTGSVTVVSASGLTCGDAFAGELG